jgi:hypothetical protein
MLMCTADEIIGHAEIECAVLAASEEVHVVLAIHIERVVVMDSGTPPAQGRGRPE